MRLLLNLGSLVLGRALVGLGFGVGAVRVGRVGWCIRVALGLVCFAWFGGSRSLGLGWPGLHSGWGIAGFWHVFLLCCWSDDGTSFWDTPYIHTF